MSAGTKRPTCQHGEYERPRGCRKRATKTVLYRRLFGHRVTAAGSVPAYQEAITFRCDAHSESVPDTIGSCSIYHYLDARPTALSPESDR